MAIFDITHLMLSRDAQYNVYDRRPRTHRIQEARNWLNDHVGEYYGAGEDPTVDIGSGWETFVMYNGVRKKARFDEDTVVTWHVDITDEAKSVLFALTWL